LKFKHSLLTIVRVWLGLLKLCEVLCEAVYIGCYLSRQLRIVGQSFKLLNLFLYLSYFELMFKFFVGVKDAPGNQLCCRSQDFASEVRFD
jgi:hypothetical protein